MERVTQSSAGDRISIARVSLTNRGSFHMRKIGILCLGALAALVAAATPASAQMTPFIRMNCSTYPSCGWQNTVPENAYHSRRLLSNFGPNGEPSVEFTQLPSQPYQYYLGWNANLNHSTPGGTVRYARFRLRFPQAGVWSAKFFILGDGDNNLARVICELRDNGISSSTIAIKCTRNIDGVPNTTALHNLSLNAWHNIQVEMQSATTTSSGNGRLKIWVDSGDYNAPSSQSSLQQLNSTNWQNVNLGYYAGTNGSSSSQVAFQIAAFEFDDQFDPSWHQGGSGGGGGGGGATPPTAPTNVRVVGASTVVLLPLLLPLIRRAWRRRRDDAA
jgi:hypothetical protein